MSPTRLSIFWQFIFLGIGIFLLIGIFLSSLVAPTLTDFILGQQQLSSVVFLNRLSAEFLQPNDFLEPTSSEAGSRFERFTENLQIPGLFRVKILNPDGVIAYSDDRALTGTRLAKNGAFEDALNLKTTVVLVSFDQNNPHYASEQSFKEGIVTMVPVTFGASPKVVGIVETYARSGFLKQQIDEVRNLFVLRIVISLAVMFATLSFIVRRASQRLEEQQRQLRAYATGLEKMVEERTKKLEESTREQVRQAEEMSRLKDEFVSLASHQLRTPPSIVNWYAEVLLSGEIGPVNGEQQKYLEEIYRANQRMVKLVNDFLNISRIELGTITIEPESLNLKNLTESVLQELSPAIQKKRTKIEMQYAQDTPTITADPKLIRIILQNLISNAVKYTQEEGAVEVIIEPERQKNDGPHVRITVRDNGYGIPKDQQEKIFTKLFRADNVRNKETDGTGLGLYLVKSVVAQSGGTIRFESEENKGSTFTVTIPLTISAQGDA